METRHSDTEEQRRFLIILQRLREERDTAIQLLIEEAQRRVKQSKFSDTLIRDLDELGKAFERTRQTAKELKSKLAQKEAEVERLCDEKLAMLKLALESGPWALYDWIKKELVQQGLEPGPDFDDRWLAWIAAREDIPASSVSSRTGEDVPTSSVCSGTEEDSMYVKLVEGNKKTMPAVGENQLIKEMDRRNGRGTQSNDGSSLFRVVFSIVLEEGALNLQFVLKKGFFFIPLASFCFWMALLFRITWHVLERTLRYLFLPLRQDIG